MCPICESKNFSKTYKLYDDRYGYAGNFNLFRCSDCGHKFLDHQFTPEEIGNLYSNYYPRSEMKIEDYSPIKYKKGFKSWFNGERGRAYTYVPKNVRVLDIGCGFGESLGYHKIRGCDVYGVEADENIKRVADTFGFNVKVGLFSANDYEKEFFEYVTMDQVIEHVTDPYEILTGIFKILKPNGYLVLSTPNSNGWGAWLFGKRWINWHPPYHLHHFSKKSLIIISQKEGFEVEKIKTITSSEWLFYQWIHLITFPQRGEKSIFWNSRTVERTLFQKILLKLISLLHKTKINHVITRFFDTIGLGDNLIVVLRKKA